MNKTFNALIRLTRYKEYIWFVIVTTLLGAAAAGGTLGWPLIAALIANELAVGFSFMINDVEDADDDALNPAKINRNPISAKDLTKRQGYIASFAVMFLSTLFYAMLGTIPFVIGIISLIVGLLYSWQRVRLKSMPFIDLITHCMMLAGFQFLPGYFAFTSTLNNLWLWPFLSVTSISMYGELFNELRDLTGDLEAGVKHTASVIGERATKALANVLLIIGVVAFAVTLFVVQLVPLWVLIVMAVLALLMTVPPVIRARKSTDMVQFQSSFQVPIQISGAIAMSIGFIVPWLNSVLRLGLF